MNYLNKAMSHKGISFDDYVVEIPGKKYWVSVCESHKNKIENSKDVSGIEIAFDEDPSRSICGVKDCCNSSDYYSDYYLDAKMF